MLECHVVGVGDNLLVGDNSKDECKTGSVYS